MYAFSFRLRLCLAETAAMCVLHCSLGYSHAVLLNALCFDCALANISNTQATKKLLCADVCACNLPVFPQELCVLLGSWCVDTKPMMSCNVNALRTVLV